MYNDVLNGLKTQLLSTDIEDGSRLRALFERRLQQALLDITTNDYVEDCLYQIEEALQQLAAGASDSGAIRDYLLGAIEALRDELHLCDVDTDIRQTAVGF